MRQYRGLFPGDTWLRMTTLASVLLSCLLSPISVVSAWGNSNEEDVGIFGNALNRDWLDNSKAISIQLEGCLWGYVDDNEDAGCMEDGSEDGTTYWYQMANCRRAQAVFSLYAGNSASCSSSNFKESVSYNILSERANTMHNIVSFCDLYSVCYNSWTLGIYILLVRIRPKQPFRRQRKLQ